MIKTMILLLSLLITLNAVTYAKFYAAREFCEWQKLGSCHFDPINTSEKPLPDQWLECAQDYQKSNVCFYGYSQCLPKDNQAKANDQIPLVCWNCYMESPSKSEIYNKFRDCVVMLWEPKLVLSVALVMLMLLALA